MKFVVKKPAVTRNHAVPLAPLTRRADSLPKTRLPHGYTLEQPRDSDILVSARTKANIPVPVPLQAEAQAAAAFGSHVQLRKASFPHDVFSTVFLPHRRSSAGQPGLLEGENVTAPLLRREMNDPQRKGHGNPTPAPAPSRLKQSPQPSQAIPLSHPVSRKDLKQDCTGSEGAKPTCASFLPKISKNVEDTGWEKPQVLLARGHKHSTLETPDDEPSLDSSHCFVALDPTQQEHKTAALVTHLSAEKAGHRGPLKQLYNSKNLREHKQLGLLSDRGSPGGNQRANLELLRTQEGSTITFNINQNFYFNYDRNSTPVPSLTQGQGQTQAMGPEPYLGKAEGRAEPGTRKAFSSQLKGGANSVNAARIPKIFLEKVTKKRSTPVAPRELQDQFGRTACFQTTDNTASPPLDYPAGPVKLTSSPAPESARTAGNKQASQRHKFNFLHRIEASLKKYASKQPNAFSSIASNPSAGWVKAVMQTKGGCETQHGRYKNEDEESMTDVTFGATGEA
jgi:hypothetical protein